jgi:serine/threonine protein phosphatase PrpC
MSGFGAKQLPASVSYRATVNEDALVTGVIVGEGRVLYGVFDGHGSHILATHCATYLHSCLAEQLQRLPSSPSDLEVISALEEAFRQTDDRAAEIYLDSNACGSCACVALLAVDDIFVAWAGDCRAGMSPWVG